MKNCSAVALTGLILSIATTASAAPAECDLATLTTGQRAIVTKADEGVEALRQYVWRTRAIYQYDLEDVATFAANRHKAERQCVEAMRGGEAKVSKAGD